MEHVAIDLGRPNSVMCQLNSEGKKSFRTFALNRPNLDRYFGGRPQWRVLIESSTESWSQTSGAPGLEVLRSRIAAETDQLGPHPWAGIYEQH